MSVVPSVYWRRHIMHHHPRRVVAVSIATAIIIPAAVVDRNGRRVDRGRRAAVPILSLGSANTRCEHEEARDRTRQPLVGDDDAPYPSLTACPGISRR